MVVSILVKCPHLMATWLGALKNLSKFTSSETYESFVELIFFFFFIFGGFLASSLFTAAGHFPHLRTDAAVTGSITSIHFSALTQWTPCSPSVDSLRRLQPKWPLATDPSTDNLIRVIARLEAAETGAQLHLSLSNSTRA